jgi:hypothetical protein
MTISSFKDLEKLIRLCRKTGVESITVDGVTFKLGDEPQRSHKEPKNGTFTTIQEPTYTPGGVDVDTKIDMPDILTEEQLMFYSSQSVEPAGRN